MNPQDFLFPIDEIGAWKRGELQPQWLELKKRALIERCGHQSDHLKRVFDAAGPGLKQRLIKPL